MLIKNKYCKKMFYIDYFAWREDCSGIAFTAHGAVVAYPFLKGF